jgi:hypothetical protein
MSAVASARMISNLTSTVSSAQLYRIVYVSSAVTPFKAEELLTLLKRARPRNTAAQITGLLLYHDGNFMQCLEGPERQAIATHERILRDPRHFGCITLISAAVDERLFSDWSMGFRNVALPEANSIPGFSDFLSRGERSESLRTPHNALRLLHSFREQIR